MCGVIVYLFVSTFEVCVVPPFIESSRDKQQKSRTIDMSTNQETDEQKPWVVQEIEVRQSCSSNSNSRGRTRNQTHCEGCDAPPDTTNDHYNVPTHDQPDGRCHAYRLIRVTCADASFFRPLACPSSPLPLRVGVAAWCRPRRSPVAPPYYSRHDHSSQSCTRIVRARYVLIASACDWVR